jgi:hypothetical protein
MSTATLCQPAIRRRAFLHMVSGSFAPVCAASTIQQNPPDSRTSRVMLPILWSLAT